MELTPEKELVNKYMASMVAIGIESGAQTLREAVGENATMVALMETLGKRLNEIAERGTTFSLNFNGDKIELSDGTGAIFKYEYPPLPALMGGSE